MIVQIWLMLLYYIAYSQKEMMLETLHIFLLTLSYTMGIEMQWTE